MVADPASVCRWNPDMYGVWDCPAGQAYYDSLIELYASWGVDFIMCDDICSTDNWASHSDRAYAGRHEIEMLSRAIHKQGRPIVLSLSPGPALIEQAWHYQAHANLWRITDDFWDKWELLKDMFARCELWQDHVRAGCYPDCDMLTPDCRPRQLYRDEEKAVWTAENAKLDTRYTALFNLSDVTAPISIPVDTAGGVELWTGEDAAVRNGELWAELPPHACTVYRLK